MAEKKDRLSQFESRWALAKEFGAIPVIGGVMAWATNLMAQWAPYSWFVGALVGAILLQAWSAIRSWQAERNERIRRIAMLEAPKGQVNPLEDRFVRQRIHISDIMPPLGVVVANKEFRNCEIVGPANIVMQGTPAGLSELAYCTFRDCDGVVTDDEVAINNVAAFIDCSFRNCTFYKVTLIMTYSAYRLNREGMGGLRWLNFGLLPKEDEDV